MVSLKLLSGFIFLLLFQTVGTAAIAFPKQETTAPTTPSAATEMPATPEFLTQFQTYIGQKYSLLLGADRSACAYRIDPTDVHEQGSTRFVTVAVSASDRGNACTGYLAFQVFQADCESNTLYQIERETRDDRRFRRWERYERTLTIDDRRPDLETSLDGIEQPPAEAICSLALSGETEASSEPLSEATD